MTESDAEDAAQLGSDVPPQTESPDITEARPPNDAETGDAGAGADVVAAALPLRQRVEAVLIVVDEPIPVDELARVLAASSQDVSDVLTTLRAEYLAAARGFELRDVAGGWRFYSGAACASDVERFVLDGSQARLTHAALETLAVIAYRQPVSRQAIAAIRGVTVDGVVRTLLSRHLIAESGLGAGGATLYVTTPFFLSRLGLSALEDLPSLAPYLPVDLDEFEESF